MNTVHGTAQAGSFESSDCQVTITPMEPGSGIELSLRSIVIKQFGEAIEVCARKTLADAGVTDARLDINDRGALDFVIRSRIITALERCGLAELSNTQRGI